MRTPVRFLPGSSDEAGGQPRELALAKRLRAVRGGPVRTCGVPVERRQAHADVVLRQDLRGMPHSMISVAIQGFGIVIWDGGGRWRTFAPTESLASLLNARVELALGNAGACHDPEDATAALLDITGARLLAVECGHGPGECDGAVDIG